MIADNVEYVRISGNWISQNGLLTVANPTYWTVDYDFRIRDRMGCLNFVATRKTTAWTTTSAWGSSALLRLNSAYTISRESHTPLISNTNVVGLDGLCLQTISQEINVRATQAMSLAIGGWCSGSVVFGLK